MAYLTIQGIPIEVSAKRLPEQAWKKTENNVFSVSGQQVVPTKLVHECWDMTACFASLDKALSVRKILESEGGCVPFSEGTAMSNGIEALTTNNKQLDTVGYGGKWVASDQPYTGLKGAWQFASGQICYPFNSKADTISATFWETTSGGVVWTRYSVVIEKNTNIGFPSKATYVAGASTAANTPLTQIKYLDNGDGTSFLIVDSRTNSSKVCQLSVWSGELHEDHLKEFSLMDEDNTLSSCTKFPFVWASGDALDERVELMLPIVTAIEEKEFWVDGEVVVYHELRFRLCAVNPKYTSSYLLHPVIS